MFYTCFLKRINLKSTSAILTLSVSFLLLKTSVQAEKFFNEVEETSPTASSMWCVYKYAPCSVGYWIPAEKEMVQGKRVALIVQGHNLTSIIDDFVDYGIYDIADEILGRKTKDIEIKPNYWYGLDVLVHLGRFLSHDVRMPLDKCRPRYDVVIGYAYSSANTLHHLSKTFAKEATEFLKDAKHVDFFAHSMGGLVTRWALEKEGLGEKYKNLVTFDSPHQGLAIKYKETFENLFSNNELCTFDMITVSPELNDPDQSAFLKELNEGISPYYETANYHAFVGNHYADLTYSAPPTFQPVNDSKFNVGSLVQDIYDEMFNEEVLTDGLVPTYSSGSVVLKSKSKTYDKDSSHRQVVPLNHRTIVGSADDLWISDPDFPRKAQFIMGKVLHQWIDSWPLE